ncbi:type IV pilin [Natronolimnobius baerhuensis]|uniref:Type IV pilin n=1 Tax=Natronolimnobius baerhuensis TaxID=253108 RepID=A0A202E9R1_9EURY|nr:type IV pilin N-terminal domain-containing protein [Natronolimnobius baerhuensis]OVE84720.1 type IV pilin [Natronolimnobius baerhuensis]
MNIGKYKNILVGSEEERAVSPVIGVILMVAITVILAAVIAAFVLDLGGSVGEEAQAGVSLEVDETEHNVVASVTSMGNADRIEIRSDVPGDEQGDVHEIDEVGSLIEFDYSEQDGVSNSDNDFVAGTDDPDDSEFVDSDAVFNGTVTAVAIIDDDDTETTVTSEDFDFYDDFVEMAP